MPLRRSSLALCLAAATMLAGSLTGSLTGSSQAAPAAPAVQGVEQERRAPLRYVALGDSYSAATGVLPTVLASPPQCLRSQRNYPHLIAERTGARLVDVTCGAADTGDFRGSQGPGIAPQLDAVRRNTQLVTMTIGGNDSGVFINSIVQCGAAALTTLGTGSPCKDRYGNEFVKTVRTKTLPSLKKALRAVHRKAPGAEVAILGYPRILPPKVGCYPQMPVARGDVPYLFKFQQALNDVVRRAAKATDTTYVNVPRASRGRDACQALGTRWIEPVLLGTNPVIVHPNARGEAAMARITMRKLGLR